MNQLVRKGRKRKRKSTFPSVLDGQPQRKGVVVRSYVVKPRKPNSGHRKLVRVRFPDKREVSALVPGEGHNLQEHHIVLVRGGGSPDLPGIKHKVVRGVYDCKPVEARKQQRSRFGTQRTK